MSDSGKSQAVIGAFVVGAVILVIVAVIVFGGGKLFQEKNYFVMYFDGSVKGLNVGSPVTFRGVKIGSVVDVTVRADPKTLEFRIPVVIEIDPSRIERTAEVEERRPGEVLKQLIDRGLRARLEQQSMITGQLQINLELMPDEPIRLSGVKHKYMEIPTVPTTLERLAKKLEELPISKILDTVSASINSLKKLVDNPALTEMIDHLNQASANVQELTADMNRQGPPLVASYKRLADRMDQLVLNINNQVQPLAGGAEKALISVNSAAERIGQAADGVNGLTAANSKERIEMRSLFNELSEAARSLRVLLNYLERYPEALIRGKGGAQRR